jgi:tRNA modification GTPase
MDSKIIVALATPPGRSAIGVIRMSGSGCLALLNRCFKGANLEKVPGNTIHYGWITEDDSMIDEVMISIFKAPKSYTKEDSAEISGHGSPFLLKRILERLIHEGATLAGPGEFTMRAFAHGRFDLAQAEAVADLIAADSDAQKDLALNQLRGGVSHDIAILRDELIQFASLIELELDFSEEDVAFADRSALLLLIEKIRTRMQELMQGFQWGNALKEGVPVAIVGMPNAGKSTLLNALLNEERALVSDVPGTTRDVIEEVLHIDGISFRFIDTAGYRDTRDVVEAMGIERTLERLKSATVVLWIMDGTEDPELKIRLKTEMNTAGKTVIAIRNKADQFQSSAGTMMDGQLLISAKERWGLDVLKAELLRQALALKTDGALVSNIRHYESLKKADEALDRVSSALLMDVSGELLAADIRESLHQLGLITGQITTDDLLESIFTRFCIGK